MKIFNNIFLRKKILIYGLGKSGISSYKFLKNKSDVYLFDDNQKNNLKKKGYNTAWVVKSRIEQINLENKEK